MTDPTARPRNHKAAWILALIALLELAIIIVLILFRAQACAFAGAGFAGMSAGGGAASAGSSGAGAQGTPSALPSVSPLPGGAAAQGGAAPGGAPAVTVSSSPIPDSNCEYKAAAAAFGSPPPAGPSCPPASIQPNASAAP